MTAAAADFSGVLGESLGEGFADGDWADGLGLSSTAGCHELSGVGEPLDVIGDTAVGLPEPEQATASTPTAATTRTRARADALRSAPPDHASSDHARSLFAKIARALGKREWPFCHEAARLVAVRLAEVRPVAVWPLAVWPLAVWPTAVWPVTVWPTAVWPMAVWPVTVWPMAVWPVTV